MVRLLRWVLFLNLVWVGVVYATTAGGLLNEEKLIYFEKTHTGDLKKRFQDWRKLIHQLKHKPVTEQLNAVNLFMNHYAFISDAKYEGGDYWKSPAEFLIDGGGDCEDYVIIKYFTLLLVGVPKERMRLTYVKSIVRNEAHMVLAYYPTPEATPYLLDNLMDKILLADKRPDLVPVYSFNLDGLWLTKHMGQENALVGQPTALSGWQDLILRMQKQGKQP